VSAVQELPEIRRQLDLGGATVLRMTPAQFGAYMATDMEKWGRVVKAAGIRAN
jgi:tripartite-type tricarboxylate transporter receptor subunit TctC